MNLPSQRPIKSLTAEQRPCNTEGAAVPGEKTGSKKTASLSPYPLPNPKNHWASPKTPNLGVVVKELDRYLVNLQIAQVLNLNFGGNFHELTLAATNKIAHCGTAPL